MSTIPTAETTFGYTGPEGRRSTRIERPVPLLITGQDGLGQEFLERTSAVSLNLHGCRYPSRHDTHVGSWITLQIGDSGVGEIVTSVRAQVRSVQIPRNPRDLYHVGVQLEKPANIWRIPSPPSDWLTAAERLAAEMPPSKEQTAAATGPGRAPKMEDMPVPPLAANGETAAPVNGEVAHDRRFLTEALAGLAPTMVPASPALPTTAKSGAAFTSAVGMESPDAAAAYARPNRVPITPERLLAALQPKIEKAAETAILAAVTKHLSPAIHAAVDSIDAAREACVQQIGEAFAQQRSAVVHTSREEMLARLEDRLDEVRSRWDAQLDGYRVRAEEIVQRIDRQAGVAQKNLGDAREVSERAVRDAQNRISNMVTSALAETLREFDQGIKLAAHRQLTNVLEEVQSLTREATAYMESNVAEARATVQTAASEAINEFRRQAEIHATVTATDTTQRLTSALSALDAEHRAACDTRRNAIQEDIRKSTEQVTDQFRQGLRAFFYSCLVAAVGAVEQHSQATRDGLQFDPKNFLPPAE
ncbi:MAG TPA: hypothetical protein VLC94_11195 [Candidatus Acidoferrum sp.]|nr:hypothetical protein [Candidatus Acidoferrum sp.]